MPDKQSYFNPCVNKVVFRITDVCCCENGSSSIDTRGLLSAYARAVLGGFPYHKTTQESVLPDFLKEESTSSQGTKQAVF